MIAFSCIYQVSFLLNRAIFVIHFNNYNIKCNDYFINSTTVGIEQFWAY